MAANGTSEPSSSGFGARTVRPAANGMPAAIASRLGQTVFAYASADYFDAAVSFVF